MHGRPSVWVIKKLLLASQCSCYPFRRVDPHEASVDLPKPRHFDCGPEASEMEHDGMLSFIAMCSLTLILHHTLQPFRSITTMTQPMDRDKALEILSSRSEEIDAFEAGLDPKLQLPIRLGVTSSATGVREADYLRLDDDHVS